jgi:hypothetical protein
MQFMTMKKTMDKQNISVAKPEGKRWRRVHYSIHIYVHWITERLREKNNWTEVVTVVTVMTAMTSN